MNTIKRIFAILGLMALLIGLMGITPVSADTTSDTETMELNKPQILKSTAKFRGKSIKVKACKAYAEKLEQQAPPRDPQALCKGKLKVKLSGIAKSAKCPEGWFGGRAEVRVTLTQSVKARAFAKSIASGRVRTWARFKIRDKAKIEGTATTTCMRIPEEEPPTHDECPNIPGDQPEGYECEEPPTHDECPEIPGDQPEGYDCKGPDAQDITLVNRVLVGNKISLDLTGTLAKGRTAEIFCKALNGGTISSGNRQTVTTTPWSVKIDYVAPGEIPDVLKDSNGNVIVPKGHDMVECIVTQDNGLTDVIRTQVGPGKFEIFEMPADPQ